MVPKGSLMCLLDPILSQLNPSHALISYLFSGFLNESLYTFLTSHMHATCSNHLILFNLTAIICD
jgi:hypothetical protein